MPLIVSNCSAVMRLRRSGAANVPAIVPGGVVVSVVLLCVFIVLRFWVCVLSILIWSAVKAGACGGCVEARKRGGFAVCAFVLWVVVLCSFAFCLLSG